MLFASWLYKDDELRDGKKLFPFVFSFSKMMLSFSKRMVSFRKVHWVFFLSLELRSSFEKKNSMDFPSGHHPFASGQHHFASGENNCKKFFAIPQYPHPYIIFWQIKTPDFIFQLLSIISHPFGFILQQTPIQNYILCVILLCSLSQAKERRFYFPGKSEMGMENREGHPYYVCGP